MKPPNRPIGEKLLLGHEEMALIGHTVFVADGQLVAPCVDRIPPKLIRKPVTGDDLAPEVFDFLEESAGQRAIYYVAQLTPPLAEGQIARSLRCRPGHACHRL
jgi:DNA-binding GntR family transcriptional regulator